VNKHKIQHVIVPITVTTKDGYVEMDKALPRNLERVVGVSASIKTYSTKDVDIKNVGLLHFEFENRTVFAGSIPVNYKNPHARHDNTFSLDEKLGANPRLTVRFYNNQNFVDKDDNKIDFVVNVTFKCYSKN